MSVSADEHRAALDALQAAWEKLERIPLGSCTYMDRAVALDALERFRLRGGRAAANTQAAGASDA